MPQLRLFNQDEPPPPSYTVELPGGEQFEVDYTVYDAILPRHTRTGRRHPHPRHYHRTIAEAYKAALHRCEVCYTPNNLEPHHRTYDRWGHEWVSDITILCRDCHRLYEINKRFGRAA